MVSLLCSCWCWRCWRGCSWCPADCRLSRCWRGAGLGAGRCWGGVRGSGRRGDTNLLVWPLLAVVTGNEAECRSGFLNSFLPELLLSPNTRLLPSASAFLLVSPVCWATVCVPVVTELLIF